MCPCLAIEIRNDDLQSHYPGLLGFQDLCGSTYLRASRLLQSEMSYDLVAHHATRIPRAVWLLVPLIKPGSPPTGVGIACREMPLG